MQIALIAIGIPGSGKTSLLKPIAEQYGLVYISRDDIRQELLGDATDKSRDKEVWQEAERRAVAALTAGKSVLMDSTFVQLEKRVRAIALARDAGAERIIGIYFTTSLETARARNAARDRVVPNDVLDWMYGQLTHSPPSREDGFDAVYTHEQLDLLVTEELSEIKSA